MVDFLTALIVVLHLGAAGYLVKVVRESKRIQRWSKDWWVGAAIGALNVLMAGVWAKDLIAG